MAKNLRRNEQIRISPIRLIDQDDQQAGIVETAEAQRMAADAGLDLVEVAPQARPPVCRIMDYGKWRYAQQKKDHKAKAHRHEQTLKEVRMRPKTDPHDQLIKVNKAKSFLEKGDKVQFTMLFRGREMAHQNRGREAFNEIKEELADIAKVERDFRMEGRRMSMVLAPLTADQIKKAKDARAQAKKQAEQEQAAASAPATATEQDHAAASSPTEPTEQPDQPQA